jgi:serine/threonine-protein kinase
VNKQAFLEALQSSTLLSDPEVDALRERFAAEESVQQIAAELQAEGKLTTYQIKRLLAGRGGDLVLGQYQITAELGQGGFGRVYKGRHTFLNRVVALKVILPELVEDDRAKHWFRREMLAATQFDHPNIVMAHDANEVDGKLYLVVEYVDGVDLDKAIRENGPLDERLATAIFRQAAAALDHAHRKGMVHRDIKPGNLLIPGAALASAQAALARGEPLDEQMALVKLTDFGLARLHQHVGANTLGGFRESSVVGTPEYISPEQARDVHAVDIRADLYSLGCAWHYALTGRPPFRSTSAMKTILQHLEETAPHVEALRPDVSTWVSETIARLLAKDANDRPQTPAELIEAIDRASGVHPPSGTSFLPAGAVRRSELSISLPDVPAGGEPSNLTKLVPELAFSVDGARGIDSRVTFDSVVADDGGSDGANRMMVQPNRIGDTPVPQATGEIVLTPPQTPAPSATAVAEVPLDLNALENLRESWHRWLRMVSRVAAEGNETYVDSNDYRESHSTLVQAVRRLGETTSDGRVRRLQDVVEPWLGLETLIGTDVRTLSSVLAQAQRLDAELFPTTGDGAWMKWFNLACVAIGVLVVGLLAMRLRTEFLRARAVRGFVEEHWMTLLQGAVVIAIPWLIVPVLRLLRRRPDRPFRSPAA